MLALYFFVDACYPFVEVSYSSLFEESFYNKQILIFVTFSVPVEKCVCVFFLVYWLGKLY